MRVTLNLDAELVDRAAALSGIESRAELVHKALEALIERERSKQLVALGGTMPGLSLTPRKRPKRVKPK